tara:strand:- start:365 stop:784 length:420 start_codon:yes stop_codon:yes gene_type:complete
MNRAERRLMAPHVRTKRVIDPSRLSGQGTGLNAHRLVAETAVKMAEECYEAHMSANNSLYKAMRAKLTEKQARLAFVARVAPTLLEDARVALATMLRQPDDAVPVSMKDEIAEALIKDTDFRANRIVDTGRSTLPAHLH